MRPPALFLPKRLDELHGHVKPVANARFDVRAFAGAAEITIFAEIGGPAGVTAENINARLAQLGRQPVLVKINSPGGDAYEGVAIYNLLRTCTQTVTVQVLGIAASAASIIAMAADRIEMARNSQIMIHNAWLAAIGNADHFRDVADILDQIDAAMAQTYAARTGMAAAKVADLMAAETFMGADQAIDLGFADALLEADADPAPLALADSTPTNARDLESRLRQIGFSKKAAAKLVAGGWSALEGRDQNDPQIDTFIARINSATSQLKKETNT